MKCISCHQLLQRLGATGPAQQQQSLPCNRICAGQSGSIRESGAGPGAQVIRDWAVPARFQNGPECTLTLPAAESRIPRESARTEPHRSQPAAERTRVKSLVYQTDMKRPRKSGALPNSSKGSAYLPQPNRIVVWSKMPRVGLAICFFAMGPSFRLPRKIPGPEEG